MEEGRGGVNLEADVPGPMKINFNRACNNVRYFISQVRHTLILTEIIAWFEGQVIVRVTFMADV